MEENEVRKPQEASKQSNMMQMLETINNLARAIPKTNPSNNITRTLRVKALNGISFINGASNKLLQELVEYGQQEGSL